MITLTNEEVSDLIVLITTGDGSATEKIFKELGGDLAKYAATIVGYDDAPDVIQESMLKIVRGAKSYRRRDYALAWIYKIVKNASIDFLRQKTRYNKAVQTADRSQASCSIREEDIFLRLALSELPEGDRTLLVLHYESELPFSEIAKILKIPKSTAKYRTDKAVARLKKIIKNLK